MRLEDALKMTKFESEKHKATLNLLYSTYWLKDRMSAAMKENGITAEQFNVLRILKGMHPKDMCVKDIGSRMIEKSSNVPRIIDKLLLKKLVERHPSAEDKRETMVSLTETGIDLLQKANVAMAAAHNSKIGITEDEAMQLNALLEKLRMVD
ncbi:MarR family transcriptional regulator [Flavipsychrobacter stenotrophus]|uniref:MarR family transcriptional regulator n=1 Tax=Flavipsychrobacter stenotrophus TaxID=2077091 RepID=A0A2S7T1E2_9BACT|nr:MarR family transcriptional regulator [Flavipsychrobacter stenotrophus]PQJ12748.1 MarR family transcriptional regulator [Flavipsychrobacter stenotrophus]